MEVVVLLGAGASYGSVGVTPNPPPLGNMLFQELLKQGGVASRLSNELRQKFEANFEDGMAAYYEETNGNIMAFQRELAEYLANFSPTEQNVYINLVRELGLESVVYSSLNYDLLFELATFQLGHPIIYSSEYTPNHVRLLKIHGSSNFWPKLSQIKLHNAQISGCGTDIEANVGALGQDETLRKCKGPHNEAPAMAMFAAGKKAKVCPSFIKKQYTQWKEHVTKSSKIFIVGVRVHEVDTHIWSVLGKVKGSVTYFGFEKDKIEFNQWKENHKKKNAYFVESDFLNSVEVIKQRCRR
ncbi:hypothetical protein [Pseudoalteromonas rubra]|uniref:hypothetical protein n=1 Tax=Pseudoalteromonas rubra TaxID=43658 RepID=UPI002DB89B31|nr:hypothetical protein [Pseudoalteromonas rubra]MEC4090156.1 hypothetical protein [Pseudoalteromonas rubra]